MSEQRNVPEASGLPQQSQSKLWFVAASVAVLLGFVGLMAPNVFNVRNAWGAPFTIGSVAEPYDAEEQATWMAWRLANHVDASAEQKAKLVDIAKTAAKDITPMRDKMTELRRQAVELLRKPSADREAIEKLRSEVIANADATSRRIAQAIGDMGETLTPEQRQNLAEDISFFSRHWERLGG